jgi:aryl-alcohol dehydrogenase-like predicted oxidoreductase
MNYRPLGRTVWKVSQLGFGCAPLSGYDYGPIDESEALRAIRAALDVGINFFDVADVYGFGQAEELLARGLENRRGEVVVATKGGIRWDAKRRTWRDCSRQWLTAAVEGSLKRLQLETIPLYQVHWPDSQTPLDETCEALEHLRRQGKIQHIGLSNFPLGMLRQFVERVPVVSVQAEYNLVNVTQAAEVIDFARSLELAILTHTSLARGLLGGKYSPDASFMGTDTRSRSPYFAAATLPRRRVLLFRVQRLAEELGRSMAAVAIRWLLDHAHVTVTLVGMRTVEEVMTNCEAMGWQLSPAHHDYLVLAEVPDTAQ